MKEISKNLKWILCIIMVLGFMFSYGQDTKTDTIHLTTEEIIEGETVVWDTIIIVTPENEDAVNDYLHKKNKGIHIVTAHKGRSKIYAKTVSTGGKKIRMYFDSDEEVEGKSKVLAYTMKGDKLQKHDGRIKIITKKLRRTAEGENELELVIESDEGGDYEVMWVGDSMEMDMKHNVWVSKDGKNKKFEFVIVDGKEGLFNVHELKDSLKNVLVEYVFEDGKKGKKSKSLAYTFVTGDDNSFTIDSLHEHLNIVKELKFISEEDNNVFVIHNGNKKTEFKVKIDGDMIDIDKNVFVYSGDDKMHNNVHFGNKVQETINMKLNMEVSDEELAELGIKAKANELKAEDFWIFYDEEKELRLKFSLETKGKTTIKVLNAKGKTLFTDKVVYFPGTYDKKISLDSKHSSPIYIYIEQGNTSTIKKLSVH